MVEDVFKFPFRPVKIIWKMSLLIEKQKELSKIIVNNQSCDKVQGLLLAEICQQIDQLSEHIFEKENDQLLCKKKY